MADDLDNILGSYNLANMYMQDLGVEKDEDKALSLYKKATLNCDDISAHNYAMFSFMRGKILIDEVILFLKKAIDRGFYYLSEQLGLIYYLGQNDLEVNYELAFKYLLEAYEHIELNFASAYHLATMCYKCLGTKRKHTLAAKLYSYAYKKGYEGDYGPLRDLKDKGYKVRINI